MGETEDLKKNVEAILFAAGRKVTQEEIESLLDIKTPGLIREIVSDLKEEYSRRDTSLLLIEEGDGWKLTIRENYLPVVQKINPHTELSKAVMETLAVIAWKQPILQSNVVDIRSNKAYDHIKELVDMGFISKEKYGRSYILKPTQKFLDYFDLPDQDAARKVFRDFKDEDLQKKMGHFKEEGDAPHLGELEVYDSGEAADIYSDRSALSSDGKGPVESLGELEVYSEGDVVSRAEGGEEDETPSEESEGSVPEEDSGGRAEGSEIEDSGSEEDEAEKAKKMAQELLAEEAPAEEDTQDAGEEIDKVDLNPALEEYVKGKDEDAARHDEDSSSPGDGESAASGDAGEAAVKSSEDRPEEGSGSAPKPAGDASEGEENGSDAQDSGDGDGSMAESPADAEYERKRKALEEAEIKREAEGRTEDPGEAGSEAGDEISGDQGAE